MGRVREAVVHEVGVPTAERPSRSLDHQWNKPESGRSGTLQCRRLGANELNRSRGRFAGESSHEAHWRPA